MKGRAIPQQPDAGPSDAPRYFARRPFDYDGAALARIVDGVDARQTAR